MANKQMFFVLLLSVLLLFAAVDCANTVNGTEPIQARDDENSEDKSNRPSVKKWFNSLIANTQVAKKSPTSTDSSNSNASISASPSSLSRLKSPYLVPVPVPMASPSGALYPYQMSYMPFMTYPYSSSSAAVVPLSMSPYPVVGSSHSKDSLALHPASYTPLYMGNPHMPSFGYDSQGFAYAIPVPYVPYMKSFAHSRPAKYKSSRMKSIKLYESKPNLEQISDSEENSSLGVETRQKELYTPTFEHDHMEPFEESEFTSDPAHEEFEGEERSKL